jgi:hypothetical protein
MELAVKGLGSDPDYTDFVMSTRFGLDWRKYDGVRMTKFLHMIAYESERDRKEHEKAMKKAEASRKGGRKISR